MSYEMENRVVGASLYKPELFVQHELKLDWVMTRDNKLILQALTALDGHYNDFGEVLAKIKEFEPHTKWTEDSLEMLSYKFHELQDYETGIKLIRLNYHEERLRKANERYLDNPTKDNFRALKDRIREKEELDEPVKNGTLDDAYDRLKDRMENGSEPGLHTYPRLDKILGGGIRKGKLITIGARPSVGKTAFAINLAAKMLVNHPNVQIDFFTLEMDEDETYDRFISNFTNISSYKLLNAKTEMHEHEKEKVLSNAAMIKESGLRIYDSLFSINQIEKQIRRRRHEHKDGEYIAIVDYIGLVETDISQFGKQAEVSQVTRIFKKLTNTLGIPIIMLSQLNRDIEKRQDKRPNLSDLRESGSVEQDSNIVGFLYRDEDDESIVKFNIAKNRGGITYTLSYRFIGSKMYFEELND